MMMSVSGKVSNFIRVGGRTGKLIFTARSAGLKRPGINRLQPYYTTSTEPFQPITGKLPKKCTAEDAVSVIKSGDTVYLHGIAATPTMLVEAMAKHGKSSQLKDVKVVHIHIEGPAPHTAPDCKGIFLDTSLFVGPNCRKAVNEGRADFMSVFLVETPKLFHSGIIPVDVALIQVSPPDEHGYCSFGTSVDCTRAAVKNAKYIIAQSNPNTPRTYGDGLLHVSHVDALVECDAPLHERHVRNPTDADEKIAELIANNLVEDGATLQMGVFVYYGAGIGTIPDAVLAKLTNHKNLGVHSEMFSDGIIPLVKCGAITNALKSFHAGKIVSAFAHGTRKLYDFMHNNPAIAMCEVSYTNDEVVIAKNPRVCAINSCVEIDLTGQVVSDSIGTYQLSGVGGQIDFLRGAARSLDGRGKPIIAMPSVTNKRESKISAFLKNGAGVVTTRAHVHYVVTEFGIANLFGKTARQRAHALINIAHPQHRENLEKAAYERLKCMPSP